MQLFFGVPTYSDELFNVRKKAHDQHELFVLVLQSLARLIGPVGTATMVKYQPVVAWSVSPGPALNLPSRSATIEIHPCRGIAHPLQVQLVPHGLAKASSSRHHRNCSGIEILAVARESISAGAIMLERRQKSRSLL